MKFKDARVGMKVRYESKKVSGIGKIVELDTKVDKQVRNTRRGRIEKTVITNHIFVKPDKGKKSIDFAPRDIKEILFPDCLTKKLEIGNNEQIEALKVYGHFLGKLFKSKEKKAV